MGSFCMNSYLRQNLVGIVLSKNTEFLQESLLFTGMMRCSQKQMEKKKLPCDNQPSKSHTLKFKMYLLL